VVLLSVLLGDPMRLRGTIVEFRGTPMIFVVGTGLMTRGHDSVARLPRCFVVGFGRLSPLFAVLGGGPMRLRRKRVLLGSFTVSVLHTPVTCTRCSNPVARGMRHQKSAEAVMAICEE
jgi:hypothetical protein